MIIVLTEIRSFPGFKEEISCEHFEDHAGKAPNISRRGVFHSDNHLGGSVLPCLDLCCEMMMRPTGIAQVSDLHPHIVVYLRTPGFIIAFLRNYKGKF